MSITGTLYVPRNCYLSTTFILRNKPTFTMGLGKKIGLFRKILAGIVYHNQENGCINIDSLITMFSEMLLSSLSKISSEFFPNWNLLPTGNLHK